MISAAKDKRAAIIEAEENASRYLADGNAADEMGKAAKAEKLWDRGQFWLDRFNKLSGNA